MAKLTKLEGIEEAQAATLKAAGVRTTGALHKKGKTPEGRRELAEQTGFDEGQIQQWVSCVDLFRISGIGPDYALLLEVCGVRDVTDLGTYEPESVYRKLAQVNREEGLVKKLPTRYQINDWVKQARRLKAALSFDEE